MIPEKTKNDFSKGSVVKNIVSLALPMTLAQLINILYNIVDRMYIGRIPEHATLSLTGLGLSMPIITVVIAFANLFGMGGAPLCSIARGKGDTKGAEKIVGNAFTMLLCTGLLLTIIGLLFKKPLLYAFGASDATFPFADSYLSIYLLGSVFVTVSLGMNSYINAQGFARVGMVTTLIGAVLNIILDPLFLLWVWEFRGRQSLPLSHSSLPQPGPCDSLPARRPSCASVYPVCVPAAKPFAISPLWGCPIS